VEGVTGWVLAEETPPSSLSRAKAAAICSGWRVWLTEGEGEKGVGAGVPGTELLAMPSSPPQLDSPARRASG